MKDPTISTLGMPPDYYPYLIEGIAQANQAYLANNSTAPLYDSGVVYRPETTEQWRMIPEMLESGFGDCEDLVAWRIAELRNQGYDVTPEILSTDSGYHAVVAYSDGTLEDPSIVLGHDTGRKNAKYTIDRALDGYIATVWIEGHIATGEAYHPLDALYNAVLKIVYEIESGQQLLGSATLATALSVLTLIKEAKEDDDIRDLVKKTIDSGKKLSKEIVSNSKTKKRRQRRGRGRKKSRTRKGWKNPMDYMPRLLGRSQSRRSRRSRRSGRSGRSRRSARGGRRQQTVSEKLINIENNRRAREAKARRGIQKAKKEIREIESEMRGEIRELNSDLRQVTNDAQSAATEVVQYYEQYLQAYEVGYDVREELMQLQSIYYDISAQFEDAVALIQDEMSDIEADAESQIEYLEEKIEYGEEYIDDVREQADEAKEQVRQMSVTQNVARQ
jgi:hypothetical protein